MRATQAAVRTLLQQKADVNAPQIDGAKRFTGNVYRDDFERQQLFNFAQEPGTLATAAVSRLSRWLSLWQRQHESIPLISGAANAKELVVPPEKQL